MTQGIDIPKLVDYLITKAYAMISCPLRTLAQLDQAGEQDTDNMQFVK